MIERQLLARLLHEEDGQSMVEYSLLVGILLLTLAVTLRAVSVRAKTAFSVATNAIHTTT